MTLIVGLSGLAGAGKSTAAVYMQTEFAFRRQRFAGPLKNMLRALGISWDDIEGPGKELPHPLLCGKSPRFAMQTLGTEWGRNLIGGNLWLTLAEKAIDDALFAGQSIVFDDCRFENEAALIRRHGGVVWRIEGRPPTLFSQAQHASEQQDWMPDTFISNDGSVDDLYERIYAAVTAAAMTPTMA